MSRSRKLARLITARPAAEGNGFDALRALPTETLGEVDPFLLIEELGPTVLQPGVAKDLPPQAHRGFEILTYIRDGEMERVEPSGTRVTQSRGELQLSSLAGGGEFAQMPSKRLREDGGVLHAFRFWVNLPGEDKLHPPTFSSAREVPEIEILGETRVRVLVGDYDGLAMGITLSRPMLLLDFEVAAGDEIFQKIPTGWNAFVYVYKEAGLFGLDEQQLTQGQLGVFAMMGEGIRIANAPVSPPLRFVLGAGLPIGETVARYGAFVMNTEDEIKEAFAAFQRK